MRFEERVEPTKERLSKGDIEVIETERGGREVRSYGFPLDFYANRSSVTLKQYDAGERLIEHYLSGVERSRYVTMRFGRVAGEPDPFKQEHHARCFRNAMQAIRCVQARVAVFDCCCVGEYVGYKRMAKLREGLDELAQHFRIR